MKNILIIMVMILVGSSLTNCGSVEEENNESNPQRVYAPRKDHVKSPFSGQDLQTTSDISCVRNAEKVRYVLKETSSTRRGGYVCTLDVTTTSKNPDWNATHDTNYCQNQMDNIMANKRRSGWICS